MLYIVILNEVTWDMENMSKRPIAVIEVGW